VRIRSVDFPERLLEAQENGSLVIFAGAGVSMGAPSNLPSFTQLAKEIAEGIVTMNEGEPEDRFLGRVASRGPNVHERAREILDRPNSFPTNVHNAIVSLFKSPNTLRIVTTNFDRHFTTVLQRNPLFKNVNIYKAPVLPLGDDFNGLVYLHGTIDDPNHMVLTDVDFGKAYLTYGWATQFLRRLFQKYTVLFIGYSHRDVVMNYLARGLPPGTSRFALAEEGTSYEQWEFLGITPVFFPVSTGPNKYAELERALVGWGERTQLSVLDHERRIQQLVSQPALPVNVEDNDYLKAVIRDNVHVKFFTRYAHALHWLKWIENAPAFQRLFDPTAKLTPQEVQLAIWFADNYSCNHVFESLSIVQKNGSKLNYITWSAIAQHLWTSEPKPPAETVAKWIAVLVASPESSWNIHLANYLLNMCEGDEHITSAIILFEMLTKPRLRLQPYIAFVESEQPRIRADFSLTGDDYWIRQAWSKVFKPNLISLAPRLEPVLVSHIVSAHNSLRALGLANEEWDPMSWGRSAIEPHPQDSYPDSIDFLIDALRDVVTVGIQDRNYVVSKASVFASSGVPILKRLAVYLISETPVLTSNTKIRWLLRKRWLYSESLKHEVFRLLQLTYPSASSRLRSELIKVVLKGPNTDISSNDKERYELAQYQIFNMLVWLYRCAPECPLVEKALQQVKQKNPHFREREHPDLNHWSGPVTWDTDETPVTADEILKLEPEQVEDLLLNLDSTRLHLDGGNVLEAFKGAIQKSFVKTWMVVERLNNRPDVPDEVWRSILQGWGETILKPEQWELVLNLLQKNSVVRRLSTEIAHLIQKGLNRGAGRISERLLQAVEHVLDNIWLNIQEITEADIANDTIHNDARSLLDDSGGQLTLCWLYLLSWHKKNANSLWMGLPENYRNRFARIVSNGFRAGRSGRAMLAANLSFLYETDSEWTETTIIPMFDWSVADQTQIVIDAWKGYLCAGRIHPDLVNRLSEWYVQSASMVDQLQDVRERLCVHIAQIALYGQMDIDKTGWILRCLAVMPASERIRWARQLRWELRHADSNVIEKAWTEWIEKYWSRRLLGFPTVLTSDETSEMVGWIPSLVPVFPKAVMKMKETPVPGSLDGLLFHELKESTVTTDWPNETTELLLHLTTGLTEPAYYLEDIKDLVTMLIGKSSKHTLSQICEQLARLGYQQAGELRRSIIKSGA
jgi:hypothetical protein